MSYAPPPYRAARFTQPRGGSGRTVALVIGGVVVLGGLVVVGLAGAFMVYGLGLVEEQVEDDLRGNPVLQAHLGELTSFEINFSRSMMEPDTETLVFDVRGVKAAGRITAKCVTVDADHEKVVSGTLRLDTGTVYDLFPKGRPAGDETP
jgi:hypothetical protein